MPAVFVVAKDGTRLMPTFNKRKVRKLLRGGKAEIFRYRPFTIRLLYESTKGVQPVELSEDTGYIHIGVSVKSEKHEYVSEQRDNLSDEKERREDRRRHYRRPRRNRLRYRKVRFEHRTSAKKEGWLAPSLRNKAANHVNIYRMYAEVCPVTTVTLETAQFDTQLIAAIERGEPVPEGKDYQHGPKYRHDTLREAVFQRDGYRCVCCGRSGITDKAILKIHHLGFKTGDRTNRMSNLATVCSKCHTSGNHKPGGKLYDKEPELKSYNGAAYMNIVRYSVYAQVKELCGDTRMTYGAVTKRERLSRNIVKSHANDAYCIGQYHPKHRSPSCFYKKCPRNNRILEKFYDAKITDIRTGEVVKGAEIGCERNNRREPRMSDKNLRIYRGEKVSRGRRSIRTRRYFAQPGDKIRFQGVVYIVKGVQNCGAYIAVEGRTPIPAKKTQLVCHAGAWRQTKTPA